ncbi:MAG: DNA cytosine methyltransferase [Candidatus Rokubacteria bacterium]|nr:DNA cytosine methyltransferase [Candidatus Rokubacteria bacterium]
MIYDHIAGRLSLLDRQIVDVVPPGGNWRDLPQDFPSKRIEQIRRTAADGQGSRSTYYGRLRWDRPSYTISTYFSRPGNGCYIHPWASRLITVREAARLQAFPDRYRFFGRGRDRFVQVGNAVPPLLAYQLARALEPGPLVDLFSGAGGLSLGFELAGFELKAAVDHDKAANETFRRNRDKDLTLGLNLADAAQLDNAIHEIRLRAGDDGVYLLAGGPPCQGFSTAGPCRADDHRNRLVFAFLAAVGRLSPEIVLIENVAALMWRGRPILREMLRMLSNDGYESSVALIHAEGYGVPQLRRRLFVLASRAHALRWARPWRRIIEPSYLDHQPAGACDENRLPVFTVRDAISDLPLDEAPSPEDAVAYADEPTSELQRWARGELSAADFVTVRLSQSQSGLFAASESR